jgi:hypothetical protein
VDGSLGRETTRCCSQASLTTRSEEVQRLCQIRKLDNPPLFHQNLKIQTDQRIHPALHSPRDPLPHAQPPELSSIQRLHARPEISHERMFLQLDAADGIRTTMCTVTEDCSLLLRI